ncbi:uncharacterized protein LOC143040000 [Oratosquilla oratoria]|uniref:uncharacterized protein LOC143040000 n=1 Tax=Oratosquilla oratoria TaxID=337810 RepID=UPI003F775ED6
MRWFSVLFVGALVVSAIAVPAEKRGICSFSSEIADKFDYVSGRSYIYNYTVDTTTTLLGAFDGESRVLINSKAHFDISAPCEYILRLSDIELVGSSRSSKFAEALSKVPLKFSFQNGVVSSVCGVKEEPAWVMNFKKGVLSAFQTSMTKTDEEILEETDITGKCTTKYLARVNGTTTDYYKTKDFDSCTLRPDRTAYFATSSYTSTSPIQSLPILRSEQNCHQKFENGVLKESECEESHQYRPFSNHDSGTVTKIETHLVFTSISKSSPARGDDFSECSLLTFDSSEPKKTNAKLETATTILEQLESSRQDQNINTPSIFYELVATLKGLTYTQLASLLERNKDTNKHKFLVDAMPLLITPASAEILRDMVRDELISEDDINIWFTSLAFVKNPSSDIFDALATMGTLLNKQGMLGVSALINNYCAKNPACEKEAGVERLLLTFEAQLGSACSSSTDEEKERIVVALKALGNAGRWVNADSILKKCFTENNDMEVRIATLEAWRHTPCHYSRSTLLPVFNDINQDPEVRIASYLAIMTCPNKEVIRIIKDRLNSEAVNQVSSFVWSHLTNLYESAAPGKLWMHDLIGQDLLKNKFNASVLKLSRNFESSFFMNEINAGATFESNVIFSGKSYLPSSAMLNLTMDLFGESINFFEIGGRFEGLEDYVERFFGPNGYYPEETVSAVLKNFREDKDEEQTNLESVLDEKDRSHGSLYLRFFGNEIYYKHLHGLSDLFRKSDYSSPMDLLLDLSRKDKIEYVKSFGIIDTHFSLPSISGLPITLKLNGTTTLGLNMTGTFQPRSLTDINIQGHIQPSAAIQLASSIHVDAFVSRSGVKMVSTLQSSTFLDGKMLIKEGKLVDMAFNMPKEKVEILNIGNQFFYYDGDQETQAQYRHENKIKGCSGASTLLGMRICGAVNYPPIKTDSFSFPLLAPMGVNVYLEKTDSHSSYIFRFRRSENTISLLFDTPASLTDRKISLILSRQENALDLNIYTPLKEIKAHGGYQLNAEEKIIDLEIITGQKETYTFVFTLSTQRDNIQVRHLSTLTISSHEDQLFKLQGTFLSSRKNKIYVTDVLITELTPKPIIFHAAIDGEPKKMVGETSLESPFLDASFKGFTRIEDNALNSQFDMEYSFMEGTKHIVTHSLLLQKEEENTTNTYSFNFSFRPSQFPGAFIESNVHSVLSPGNVESKANLTNGPVVWNAEYIWSYDRVQDDHVNLTTRLAVQCPAHSVDILFFQQYLHNKQVLDNAFTLRLSKQLEIQQKARFAFSTLEYNVLNSITIPEGTISSALSFNRISEGQYNAKMSGKLMANEVNFEINLKNKSTPTKFDLEIGGYFNGMGQMAIIDTSAVASKDNAILNLLFNMNDRHITVKADASHTSLFLDINVLKHMTLDAKIVPTGKEKTIYVIAFWDKDNDPSKVFNMTGMILPNAVHGSLKYLDNEFLLGGQLNQGQLQLEAQWTPDQRITSIVSYSLDEKKSLSVMIETPFTGYKKQHASIIFHTHGTQLRSSVTATWDEDQELNFSMAGTYEGSSLSHIFVSEISFTSTIVNYEQAKISFHYRMDDNIIKSNLISKWKDQELQGNFNSIYSAAGPLMELTFKSPFTKDLMVSFKNTLKDKDLAIAFEASYDSETLAAVTIKGYIDISDKQAITLSCKMDMPVQIIPKISGNLNYNLDDSSLTLHTMINKDEECITLNISGEKKVTEDTTSVTGDLRFTTPFTHPLILTLVHNHDMVSFTTNFEISRIWSTSGIVKVHSTGKVSSTSEFELSTSISSPVIKVKTLVDHKFINNTLNSNIDFDVNDNQILIAANGVLDTSAKVVKLNVGVTSTVKQLHELKVSFDHVNEGKMYETNIFITKGQSSLVLNHGLLFTDAFNWENTLSINNIYILKNKQTLVGLHFVHNLEYTLNDNVISSKISFNMKRDENQNKIDASLSLKTPYTNDLKLFLDYQQSQNEVKATFTIEYTPTRKITASVVLRKDEKAKYIMIHFDTPFFHPLTMEGSLALAQKKILMASVMLGKNKASLTLKGAQGESGIHGLAKLDTTYLTHPIEIKGAYDITPSVKHLDLSFAYQDKYRIQSTITGSEREGEVITLVELPYEKLSRLSLSTKYVLSNMPYTVSTTLAVNDHHYTLQGKLSFGEVGISVDLDGRTGDFSANWQYDPSMSKAQVHVNLKSPVTTLKDLQASLEYAFEEKNYVNISLKCNSQEMKFYATAENEQITIKGSTPFSGWETFGGSLLFSGSTIFASVFRNEHKFELNGQVQIKSEEGLIIIDVTTPFTVYENFTIEATYHFQGINKSVNFKSNLGSKQLSFEAFVNLEDLMAPEMSMEINIPFEPACRLGGNAKWNMKSEVKTVNIKTFCDDKTYHWALIVTHESKFKGKAVATIVTPLAGWTSLILEGQLDFSADPYSFSIVMEKEGVKDTYSVTLHADDHTIFGLVETPFSGWENAELRMHYNLTDSHMIFKADLSKSSDKYQVQGSLLMNKLTPKLKLEIDTKTVEMSNTYLAMEADLIKEMKEVNLSFVRNKKVYSMNLAGKRSDRTGEIMMTMKTPIMGFSLIDLTALVDFNSEVKTANFSIVRENVDNKISVEARIQESSFLISVITPMKEFETIRLSGHYAKVNMQHNALAYLEKNSEKYFFNGLVDINEKVLTLSATSPISGYGKMSVSGSVSNNHIEMEVSKENENYQFVAEYHLTPYSVSFTLQTPFKFIADLSMKGHYNLQERDLEVFTTLQRNGETFEINSRASYSPLKSYIYAFIATPFNEWKEVSLNIQYDIMSDVKKCGISVEKDGSIKGLSFEASYNMNSGYFRIETPIEGFQTFEASYNLDIDKKQNKLEASFNFKKNIQTWTFVTYGHFSKTSFQMKFKTPFEGYDTTLIEANLDTSKKTGEAIIQFGQYISTCEFALKQEQITFAMTTPFDNLRFVSLDANYNWNNEKKDISVKIFHNEFSYHVTADLRLSGPTSEISASMSLPFTGFETLFFSAKYDVNNKDQLLLGSLALNEYLYGFSLGGYLNGKKGKVTLMIETPIKGWRVIKMFTKIDLTVKNKNVDVLFEKNGDKLIVISGNIVGDDMEFNLNTPLQKLKNFKFSGTLDRAKRSVRVKMVKDEEIKASVLASFHSFKLIVKTPFEMARKLTWTLSVGDNGRLFFEWKRNDNFLIFDVVPRGTRKSFEISLKSELEGLQSLTIDGHINTEKLEAHLGAQVNDDNISFDGTGTASAQAGNMKIDIQSPFQNFKKVTIDLSYNIPEQTAKLEASSSSSDFHLKAEVSDRLEFNITMPYPQYNNQLEVLFTPNAGHIHIVTHRDRLWDLIAHYETTPEEDIKATAQFKQGELVLFNLNIGHDTHTHIDDIQVEVRKSDTHHSAFHLHREEFDIISLTLERDGKEITIKATGEMKQLPMKGHFHISVTDNLFHDQYDMTAEVDLDRTSTPRSLIVELSPHIYELYKIEIYYEADLQKLQTGKFDLHYTTPDKNMQLFENISSSWDFSSSDSIDFNISVNDKIFKGHGKLTLAETNLSLTTNLAPADIFSVEWKFSKSGTKHDHRLRMGLHDYYLLIQVTGNYVDVMNVDMNAHLKINHLTPDLNLKIQWSQNQDNSLTGSGSFIYGEHKGQFKLIKFKLNIEEKTMEIAWEGTSNILEYNTIHFDGNIDFNNKCVIKIHLKHDNINDFLEINFTDLSPEFSNNSALLQFAGVGLAEIVLKHDFREVGIKSIDVLLMIGSYKSSYHGHWNLSKDLNILDSNITIKSYFFGNVSIEAKYDTTNIRDSCAQFLYRHNEVTYISLIWIFKDEADSTYAELAFNSHVENIPSSRFVFDAHFLDKLQVDLFMEYSTSRITMTHISTDSKSATLIETTFKGYEKITIDAEYNSSENSKTGYFTYTRGDHVLDIRMYYNTVNENEGSLDLKIAAPFEVFHQFSIEAQWRDGKAIVNWSLNEVPFNFTADVDVKSSDNTSIEFILTLPDFSPITLTASYNMEKFIHGITNEPETLASISVLFKNNSINFNLEGFHNREKIYARLQASSSFDEFRIFMTCLNYDLQGQERNGVFELQFNDHHFKLSTQLELKDNNGFYFKGTLNKNSLSLTFGLGYHDQEYTLTAGYGPDIEVTVSMKPNERGYKEGFSGKIDLPKQGYHNMEYEVEYGFKNYNQLYIDVEIDIGDDQDIQVHFLYDSEGVEARFSSYFTGDHKLRAKRSFSTTAFFTELGYNEYELKLKGGLPDDNSKRGLLLEGEVFGKKVLIDTLFQSKGSEYLEGKLTIETPFENLNHLGGRYTWTNKDNRILGRAEIILPFYSYTFPKIVAEIDLDTNGHIYGHGNINVFGQIFSFIANVKGSSLSTGYIGGIEIVTPFAPFPELAITAFFKADPIQSMQLDLKIIAQSDSHILKIKYDITNTKASARIFIDSTQFDKFYVLDFIATGNPSKALKIQFSLNNHKAEIEYEITDTSLKVILNIHTSYLGKNSANFMIDTTFQALDKMNGKITATVEGKSLEINGAFKVENRHIKCNFIFTSSFVDGTRKIDFDILIPTSPYTKLYVNSVLIANETHAILFSLDLESEINLRMEIDTPVLSKVSLILLLQEGAASITLLTPDGAHEAKVSWIVTHNNSTDYVFDIHLSSPLLSENYMFKGSVSGGQSIVEGHFELAIGNKVHELTGVAKMEEAGGIVNFDLATPFMDIQKAFVGAKLSFTEKLETSLEITLADYINQISLLFDKDNKKISITAESPFLPNGAVQVEATIDGQSTEDVKLKLAFTDAKDTLSGLFKLKHKSNDIYTSLKILTPFKGYKKMKFGASYSKASSSRIHIYSDSITPFMFIVDATFGNTENEFHTNVSVETPIERFEKIGAALDIPLDKFQPRMSLQLPDRSYIVDSHYEGNDESKKASAFVTVNGVYKYGADAVVRTKVPYEFGYRTFVKEKQSSFHIRTDSSFLNLVTPST